MSGILLSQLPKDIPASSLIYVKEVASLGDAANLLI